MGGGLQFQRDHLRPVLLGATSALKLLALPLLAVLVCRWLDASAPVTTAACFYAALPTASNAYIMARQMGGDAPLMASLVKSLEPEAPPGCGCGIPVSSGSR